MPSTGNHSPVILVQESTQGLAGAGAKGFQLIRAFDVVLVRVDGL
jgi:hypothetical protein